MVAWSAGGKDSGDRPRHRRMKLELVVEQQSVSQGFHVGSLPYAVLPRCESDGSGDGETGECARLGQ